MKRVVILILWCICTCLLQAQTPIIPELLTIEDGLSQGYVSAILQDREGFLWVGTKNGLNRYDGRQFEEFTHNPDDPYSISNDWVESIAEKGDFLIIGTHSPYLNLFHRQTKKFYHIPLKVNGIESFSLINSITQVVDNQFWINSANNGQIIRVTFPNQFWEQFPTQKELLEAVKVELVLKGFRFYEHTEDSNFLLLNRGRTHKKINVSTLDTSAFRINVPDVQLDIFQTLTSTLSLCHMELAPDEQFELYRLKQGGWKKIPADFYFKGYVYYDKQSNLIWLQRSIDNTLLAFELNTILGAKKITEKDAAYCIKDIGTSIRSFYKDRSGILWVGTSGLGVIKISPRKLVVKNYLSGTSIDRRVFFLRGGGLLGYTNVFVPDQGDRSKSNKINDALEQVAPFKIFWLEEEEQQWLAVINNDRYKLELVLYSYQNDKLQELFKTPLTDAWIDGELSMLQGLNQKLYISFTDYFVQYDPATQVYQSFRIDLFKQNFPAFFYLAQTANGTFWIGTSQGLIKAQAKGDEFDFQLIQEGFRNKICASLLVDPKDPNILWIGTKGGGLHRLDTRTMEFEYLNTQNGLPNDVIYGVLNDEEGNLWLSSNKGIINYHPKTGDIRNFTSADGMQSDEFNTYAFGKAPHGTLMFGGINGLNIFHPKDLKDNPHPPEVRIIELEINNTAINTLDSTSFLKTAIECTAAITLDYAQNSIALTFAALEFTAPSKNIFSYYLEGAEAEWAHTSTDNRAPYLDLAPGKYTFKIKAANGDLVWSEKVTTLDITILPPWYRTKVAYLIYALLLGFIFWLSRQAQRRRLQLKHRLELEQKEAERLKELENFRSQLYTNITHEFRTPLTVILGTSERLETRKHENHPERKEMSLIRRNGENMLNLVNQMLDLSKIENNKLQIHYQQGDILRYLRYITESYYSLANAANVLLKMESNQTEIWMDYDAEKIRQIISNLLSNAIKYTPSGGRVLLIVKQQADQLQIEVKDTGRGIPSADLVHIFERYYQAQDDIAKVGGTGIGLALTNELVKLLDGSIHAESKVGKGSTFTVLLPIRKEASLQEFVPTVPAVSVASEPKIVEQQPHLKTLPKLLIIEDNLDVVEYLTLCLEADYELTFAFNGQAGIDSAFERPPDIIISDVMMPEKTGLEVTDTLKKDERTSHIPIVLLTAKADIQSRLAGLRRGADVYLPKPFHQEELLTNLENLLAVRKQLQAKYQSLALGLTPSASQANVDEEEQFIQKLRALLEANLEDANLNSDTIAKAIGMSRSNLYAKLSAVAGVSFNAYLRTLRLNKAKELLTSTSLNISEIAYRVGFNDPKYFSRKFTQKFGLAPSKMRN